MTNSQPLSSEAIRERYGFWPYLSRFYGLSFDDLRSMPRWAVKLYWDYLESIRAEEQLALIHAVGHPHLEKQHDRREAVRKLTEIADRFKQTTQPIPDTDEEWLAQVAAAGIPVRIVDKDGNYA